MNSGNDVPRRLGDRYEVGEVLGRGGMAEVHLSRDSRLGRLVAVKMLRPDLARDPVFQARFRKEAHSAAALNHPSVVAVYDTGEDTHLDASGATARLPYIVMEYVQGQTGKELLTAAEGHHGPDGTGLGTERAVEITAGVLTALEYSHRQGIVHRDIKPANVMITPAGVVKVMDFGIARAMADTSATMTATSAVIGTAQYLSPEQARGETVDARTDLYSTGCLLYELLTGRPPFVGDSPVSVAYQHVREVPQPPSVHNPAISDALDRVVLKALAKDREDRYADAEEFRLDLLAAARGRPVGAPAVGAATVLATQALPSSAEATQALTAAGYGAGLAGAGLDGAAAGAGLGGSRRRAEPVETTSLDPYAEEEPVSATRSRVAQEEPPRRRRGAVIGIVLAVLVALGLLGLVASTVLGQGNQAAAPAAEVSVPSVIGRSEAEARTAIELADLVFAGVPAANAAPAGQVVNQDPPAARPVAPGSTVTVTVSSGPAAVPVPDLEGQTESQARAALLAAGLAAGETVDEPSDTVTDGRVTRTDPVSGSSLSPNSRVTLYISTGQVQVEDYTGVNVLQATAELSRLGFEVRAQDEEVDGVEEDTVVRQDPPPGGVAPGATITLYVAVAPTPTATPTETPTATETSSTDGTTTPPSDSATTSSSSSSSSTPALGGSIAPEASPTSSSG